MDKKLFVAMGLSLAVLFVYQYFFRPAPQAPAGYPAVQEQRAPEAGPALPETPAKVAGAAVSDTGSVKENETVIRTEKFEMVFSDVGGGLKSLSLAGYGDAGQSELLVEARGFSDRIFALTSDTLKGLEKSVFTVARKEGSIEYNLEEKDYIGIKKTYFFSPRGDHVVLEVSIKNLTPRKSSFSYTITGPSSILESGAVKGRSFVEADALIDGKIVKKRSVKGRWQTPGDISWVTLKNRYFAVALKPTRSPESLIITEEAKGDLATFIRTREQVLSPGETTRDEYLLYAGPIDEKKLASFGYGFENIIDYGWFGAISKVLLAVLRFFQKGVRNWGLAIILLTIMINILTFPLTRKSFVSMHQMKKVQPHMQKLKELHKDNPQRMNKEMMELYKKYNVNPFGGCLPMLLQIPIFVALYQALIRSVELKGAHFLWVKDLSRPDALPIPFSLPVVGNHLNILPLLMVVMMFLQQKVSQGSTPAMTDDQASQQKMMMIMMPLVFGFLFYNMPSGLVLYWLTNTILMTSEQTILLRSHK